MELNKEVEEFHRALREIFIGTNGTIVAKMLHRMYVESSALDRSSNSELTFYRLGQKELIQGLLRDAFSTNTDDSFKIYYESNQ